MEWIPDDALASRTTKDNQLYDCRQYCCTPHKKGGRLGINLGIGETVTIANSIIWHPGAGVDDIYAYNGETTSISYSDVRDPADPGESGTGVIHSDPSFVGTSDYRLNTGSPCIDTGSNSASGIPSTDLVGNPRIADGDGNGSTIVDMGAYEKTTPADTTPDVFTFTDQTGVLLNTLRESNSITVSGIAAPASISITGGEYRIGAGSYTSAPGTVSNGNTVTVRQTSSASFSTTTNSTLTIGGVSDIFSLTTLDSIPSDTTPDAFTFTDQAGVSLNSLRESNSITVVGITAPSPISIIGGEYKIGAGSYTSAPGTVNNGDTITVRQTSSASFSTTTNATLTIGGVSDTFSLTTLANSYDGNGDGIPDYQQPNVASMNTFSGLDLITLASPNGTTLANAQAKDNPSPGNSPSGVTFPYGFFDFIVNGLTPGGATTVTLYLPVGAAPNTYYKYGPTPGNTAAHWYEFLYDGQTGAVMVANVITLHFADGLRGDDDLTADGIVIDQGGPGIVQQGGYKLYLPHILR